MPQEKRKSKRMNIDMTIKLDSLATKKDTSTLSKDAFSVELVNVSLDGLAFKSSEELKLNTFYNAEMRLWSNDVFNNVIEIIRMENKGDAETLYGCRFIGMKGQNQSRILVHQIIEENSQK